MKLLTDLWYSALLVGVMVTLVLPVVGMMLNLDPDGASGKIWATTLVATAVLFVGGTIVGIFRGKV